MALAPSGGRAVDALLTVILRGSMLDRREDGSLVRGARLRWLVRPPAARPVSDWLGQGDDEPGPRGAARTRRTARAVSPARETAASRALLLYFAAVLCCCTLLLFDTTKALARSEGLEPPTF